MSRCPKCGEYNGDQDDYCYNCGTRLVYVSNQDGFDVLVRDFRLQSFWALRLIAYGFDVFFVSVFGFLLSVFAYFPLLFGSLLGSNWDWRGVWAAPFYLGLGQIIYSSLTEYAYGATFGKQIIGLKVVNRKNKRPSIFSVFIRNLSKAHWVMLLIDFISGVFRSVDPRDKYLEKVSGTYVFNTGRGIQIPFLSRPYRTDVGREIVPVNVVQSFDPFSILNVGVLFVVVATIILNSPSLPVESFGWLISSIETGYQEPPVNLLSSSYWFLMAMGVWGIVSGVARYLLKIHPIKSVQDIVNGCAGLVLGVYLRNAQFTMNGLVTYLSFLIGFMILQIVFYFYYSKVKEIPSQ
jgi:uncharacterized RDD family membrane protein YckC